ncbi:MAG: hypothetical protein DCC51_07170 [Anaerolineae bacterium]|nr:MAG: hypothetical protein DCC51_07170 [Anaerolineae bacterium]
MTPRSDDLTGGPSARQVYESLTTCLHKWDGRRRRQELWRWLPRGLLAGLLVGFVVALLSRQRPLLMREELAFLGLATALIGASLAGLVVLLRRRPLVAQALFADRQFGLRERILALALVFGLVLWLPNPQEAALIEQRAVAEAVAQETATLETLAADIAADDTLTPEQATSLTRPIDEALAALDEPAISRESAVAALSQAEREMQALSQEFDNTALNDALAEAAAPGGPTVAGRRSHRRAGGWGGRSDRRRTRRTSRAAGRSGGQAARRRHGVSRIAGAGRRGAGRGRYHCRSSRTGQDRGPTGRTGADRTGRCASRAGGRATGRGQVRSCPKRERQFW